MYKSNASDRKERTLAEIVIIVLLSAILMMSFIYYFFKQEDQLTQVALKRISQSFSTKVTAVHAQWFMDKQPNIVIVKFSDNYDQISENKSQAITVNKNGWIDSSDKELACAKIWELVIMEPMKLLNIPISAVEIKKHNMDVGRICQYELPKGEYFQYNSQNGKVSDALQRTDNYQ